MLIPKASENMWSLGWTSKLQLQVSRPEQKLQIFHWSVCPLCPWPNTDWWRENLSLPLLNSGFGLLKYKVQIHRVPSPMFPGYLSNQISPGMGWWFECSQQILVRICVCYLTGFVQAFKGRSNTRLKTESTCDYYFGHKCTALQQCLTI